MLNRNLELFSKGFVIAPSFIIETLYNTSFETVMAFISTPSLVLNFRVWVSMNTMLSTISNAFYFIEIPRKIIVPIW